MRENNDVNQSLATQAAVRYQSHCMQQLFLHVLVACQHVVEIQMQAVDGYCIPSVVILPAAENTEHVDFCIATVLSVENIPQSDILFSLYRLSRILNNFFLQKQERHSTWRVVLHVADLRVENVLLCRKRILSCIATSCRSRKHILHGEQFCINNDVEK